jgi:hypothetical protein
MSLSKFITGVIINHFNFKNLIQQIFLYPFFIQKNLSMGFLFYVRNMGVIEENIDIPFQNR